MITYFSSTERLAALDAEARSWLGTPFVPHAMIKGAGADCVHLVAGIYIACGALPSFVTEAYTMDEGRHLHESKIMGWLVASPRFQRIPGDKLQAGDCLTFTIGKVAHHIGLIIGPAGTDFIHALPQREATLSNLRESFYRKRITAAFRPVEVES